MSHAPCPPARPPPPSRIDHFQTTPAAGFPPSPLPPPCPSSRPHLRLRPATCSPENFRGQCSARAGPLCWMLKCWILSASGLRRTTTAARTRTRRRTRKLFLRRNFPSPSSPRPPLTRLPPDVAANARFSLSLSLSLSLPLPPFTFPPFLLSPLSSSLPSPLPPPVFPHSISYFDKGIVSRT